MVPRMNIRLENGLMRQYAADRDISKHPELGAVVREQLLLNVAMHEKKMTTNEKGKPLPSAQLERVRASDAYRQLAELKDVFSAIEK